MKNTVQKQKRHLTGRLLSLLMLLFVFTGAVKADIVELGGGVNVTSKYVPACNLYNYSFTQQIYTADEIGMSGTISSIAFKPNGAVTRQLDIYMANTTKTGFDGSTDWITVTSADLVYSGSVEMAIDEWVTVALDAPFAYNGVDNLAVIVNDKTGSWSNAINYYVYECNGQAIYTYQDSNSYDPTNPDSNSGTVLNFKNQIQLAITPAPDGELTVYDGTTTNIYVPLYGYWADAYNKCEIVYPASALSYMNDAEINSVTFYTSQTSVSFGSAVFQVFLAEVANETISAYYGPGDATIVYTGSLSVVGGKMVIEFATPYLYSGGNLLLGFYETTKGSYSSTNWYGVSVSGASVQGHNSSSLGNITVNQRNFIPKTTFAFEAAAPTIVANPTSLDLGDRPSGYSADPATFELSCTGANELEVTSIVVDNEYFQLDVEAPFTVSNGNPVTVTVTTGSAEPGVQNGLVTITYGKSETVTVDLTANAYDVVSPDIWEVAEEVTEFPFHTVTETDNLYHNYDIPGSSSGGKDAVYKVTFTEDVLLSAGNNGDNAATKVYTEDFNGEVGPGLDNYYDYYGPEVNPGPVNMWFAYEYTGANTFFGTSAGGGYYAGYKIPAAKIEELGIANCSFVTVETAAYDSYPYDLYIFRGGDTPFDGELVYSKLMDYNPVARYFFDVNIDEPFLVGTEDLWVIFYSESRYMMYCGKNPVDTENGKAWAYNPTSASPAWSSYETYTPQIFCQFLELPTGRTVTMNPANMEIKSNPNAAAGEVGEMAGVANGVSKAQHYMEAMAQNRRSSRDMQTLTVYEGTTTSGYVPIYGYYADGYLRAQYVMADDQLTGMIGGTISSMKFYLSSSDCTLDGTFSVYMGTYGSILIDGFVSPEEFSTVYTGNVSVSDGEMVIDFTDPFVYNGGNLLIGFDQTVVSSGYATTTFLGTTVNGASVQGYSYSSLEAVPANQRNFIPQTTFTYEIGEPTPPQPQGPVYQISEMYVPAGTYYIVTSSTTENFEFDMAVADMPAPVQAEVNTPFEGETNVESPYYAEWVLGYYTKEMQVLYGTTNPPTTQLIGWTDYLVESAFIPSLDNNRNYYFQVNERNEKGETEGEIIAFTTKIEPVTGFAAVSPYIYVGDVAELTWDAIQDEEFLGYNIYSENGKLNDELITDTSYLIEGLEYNPAGYNFFAKAVYEAGESAYVSTTVYVSGYGVVDGHVYEQDGETPIEGARVEFQGTDDFGRVYTYGVYTNEEGYYSAQLVAGYYDNIYAAKAGYQTAYQAEEYSLAYQEEIESVNFILDEEFYGVDYVDATEELPYPRISWGNYLLKAGFEDGMPEGWTMIDADGDGYNWGTDVQGNYGGHESDHSVASASWMNVAGALTPDNYLVTPEIPLGGVLSFWARTNDTNYPAEHFGVAVSTESNDNPEDFNMLQEWTMTVRRGGDGADRNTMNRGNNRSLGEWYKYEVDLSAYEGQNGYVAIRHFNSYDMFVLSVDDVVVDNRNYTGDRSFEKYRIYRTAYDNVGPYNTENTTLVGEIISGSFIYDESFDEVEEGLYKYGVSVVYEGNRDGALNEFTETFDEGMPETWSMIDADGDGRCWMLGSQAALGFGHGHNGSNDMMISKSYENGSSVYPDNYLVTPLVQFGKQSRFEFYACAQDANYPEYVGVAVSTAGNEYSYDFATVAEWPVDNERAQGIWHKYVVELDQYAGQEGYIAIRHFNSSYNFYLDIDDVKFYDIDIQGARESAIRWSETYVGKDMYLTDGAVNISVTLASGDAPEGITATFKNLTQPEYEDIVVELDENGYYSFDSFRKGDYKVVLEKLGYESLESYESIWEPIALEFLMNEELKSPTNFTVSPSGVASWKAPQANSRHFENRYYLSIYDESYDFVWGAETTDTLVYIDENYLMDGVVYLANVVAYYSTQDEGYSNSSMPAICYWTYMACNHYLGANNLTAKPLDEGVYMRWEYPGVDEERGGNREAWDLLTSFNATSAYQYGICTDGTNIYTSSWSASSSSMFYKYDKDGNLLDEFNIDGCGQLRDLTYDGQFFYGVANSSTVYCVDFNTKTLISTFESAYGTMRCITYDPERNDFWVVGNWGGDLTLINRYGNIVFTGPTPSNVSGVAYYKDSEGVEHVFMSNNSSGAVYDYNIATNTISEEPVCNLTDMLPGFSGSTGGCHVGYYNGKMAFFADVQQNPQLIGIFELGEATVETPLGARIYVNGNYAGFTEGNEWMFEGYNQYNTFSLRVVYEGNKLSCMQDAYMLNKYWIESYVYNGDGGYVTESAYYFEGDTCTLTATPYEDYDFYCWYNYGETVSYEPTYSFVVRGYNSYSARFITDHYWNDVNLYENNMGVIGIVKIEDEEVDGVDAPLVEIGAFCNGECRGHQRLHYYPQVDRYLVYLTVYGNEGDDINFHLSINGIEQSMMCTTTVVFEADAVVGTPFEPYVFNFYSTFWNEQFNEFNAGWNWWSTYIEQGGNYNGLADLQAYLTNTGYMISSQTAYTMNYGAYGWYGSLNSIDNESMYKIKMNEPGYSDLYYYNARTDLHPITVVPGWNYIGYVSYYSMDLEDALIGLEPSNGDMIKSQYAYANYYEGYGWFGSLNYMEPGMGYMYKAADTATFIYGEATRGITKENLTAENNHWMPNTNAYRDNMTVMAVVNLNDVEVNSDNYELAAFADGECRGSVRLTYAEPLNRYVAFLTVAGEETATLSFGLYDAATGAECYSDDNFEFNSDIMVGNPGEPVVISFKGMNDNSGFMVYPNPVAKGERVNIVIPNGSDRVQVEVVNSLGEVVSVETLTQSQASIALPEVPGVYTVRIITDNKDTNFKKVIVK